MRMASPLSKRQDISIGINSTSNGRRMSTATDSRICSNGVGAFADQAASNLSINSGESVSSKGMTVRGSTYKDNNRFESTIQARSKILQDNPPTIARHASRGPLSALA